MKQTIRHQLFLLTALSASSLLISLVVTSVMISRTNRASKENLQITDLQRKHGNASMMNDAIRGDVYAALHVDSSAERNELLLRHKKHIERFRLSFNEKSTSKKSPALMEALKSVQPKIDNYLNYSEKLIQKGSRGEIRNSDLRIFEENYRTLEKELEVISDLIQWDMELSTYNEFKTIRLFYYLTIVIFIACLLIFGFIAHHLQESIGSRIDETVRFVQRVSSGDFEKRIEITHNDELSLMGAALNNTVQILGTLMGSFSKQSLNLQNASKDLTGVSEQMSSSAEQTSAQATVVSSASQEISRSVQSVASATEEMAISIKEIAKNATEASRIASNAFQLAQQTQTTILKLNESSNEIGKVIKVVTGIAEQTNLLALNATIEAARAGDVGKGFAVVANEVKELAKETAQATEDITQKISAIQSGTTESVKAIQQITGIINQVSDIQSMIASAVEEQTATTNEIEKNLNETAKGSSDIVQNMVGIAQAAQHTTQASSKILHLSNELMNHAIELHGNIEKFKHKS